MKAPIDEIVDPPLPVPSLIIGGNQCLRKNQGWGAGRLD